MNDATLIRQLTMQIEQQLSAKVVANEQFTIPFSTVEMEFLPILKKRMDILMKMLLTSFQSGAFHSSEQLAAILMVDPLFIDDLTHQMERSKLIEKEDRYHLTAKGEAQLAEGVYEEQMPVQKLELVYSSLHEHFTSLDVEALQLMDELPEPLSDFETEHLEIDEEVAKQAIQQQLAEDESELIVEKIEKLDVVELHDFPYILFICLDEKANRMFSRAYSLYTNMWDDEVSAYLDKRHVTTWREKYS